MQQLLDNRTEREIKRRERRDSEVTKRAFETKKKKKKGGKSIGTDAINNIQRDE